jgi:hypothetical protein
LTFKEVSCKDVVWVKLAHIRVQFHLSLNTYETWGSVTEYEDWCNTSDLPNLFMV